MNISGSAPVDSAGISVRIVDLLQRYDSAIAIDFLAKELGRRPESLLEDLAALEAKGVVEIDKEKYEVRLAGDRKRSALSGLWHLISGVK